MIIEEAAATFTFVSRPEARTFLISDNLSTAGADVSPNLAFTYSIGKPSANALAANAFLAAD